MSPTFAPLRLRRVTPTEVDAQQREPFDDETERIAAKIVEDVRQRGEAALREYAEGFGEVEPGDRLVLERAELDETLTSLPGEQRTLLERTAGRIRTFAEAQRASLDNMTAPVTGGQAGQRIRPVERAGCYAPGGRFPMPSSVLMTAVTARVAGVSQVGRCIPRWQYRVVGEPGH